MSVCCVNVLFYCDDHKISDKIWIQITMHCRRTKFIVMVIGLPTFGFIVIVFILSFHNDAIHIKHEHLEISLSMQAERTLDNIGTNNLSLVLTKHSRMAHVIADKKHKILYCGVPKNSCTIFKLLFHILSNPDMRNINIWNQHKLGHIHVAMEQTLFINIERSQLFRTRNQQLHSPYPLDTKHNLLQTYINYIADNKWRKLVVIRDPLERLLSGYLDKCVRQNMNCFKYKNEIWEGDNNIKNKNNFTVFINHFKKMITQWESNNIHHYAKWKNIYSNHFSPQYSYCNLDKLSKYFTDIIYYKHWTINDQTEQFLKSLNDTDISWFYKWGDYNNQTLFDAKYIHVTSKYLSNDVKMQANFYKKYYYSKEFAESVMTLFQKDYKLFNISKAKWIDYL
eukprot:23251_1